MTKVQNIPWESRYAIRYKKIYMKCIQESSGKEEISHILLWKETHNFRDCEYNIFLMSWSLISILDSFYFFPLSIQIETSTHIKIRKRVIILYKIENVYRKGPDNGSCVQTQGRVTSLMRVCHSILTVLLNIFHAFTFKQE